MGRRKFITYLKLYRRKSIHFAMLSDFFLKFEIFSILGLTNASSCGIITTVAERSAQKLQMESWLSGRRRTTGNRVTVMSGSRVQIPNSPPLKRLETLVSGLFSYLRTKKTAAGIYGSFFALSE